jgi:hypothetical protein
VTDQRGLMRPLDFGDVANATGGDGTDIGAFEVQPLLTPPGATPKTPTPTPPKKRGKKQKHRASAAKKKRCKKRKK